MIAEEVETEFKRKVCAQIRVVREGTERFRVFTPFRFDDGDLLSVVLKRDGGGWGITDEGSTFMRLTYEMDEKTIMTGARGAVIEGALEGCGIEDRDGVLWSPVVDDRFGDALFSLIQAALRISDVYLWTRSAVRDTFLADLRAVVNSSLPPESVSYDWHDQESDPRVQYPVDFRIEVANKPPLFLFGVNTDAKCSVATIVILHYQKVGTTFSSLAVFDDQEGIGRRHLARLSDVVDKQFSSLVTNRKPIADYLAKYASDGSAKA